MTGFSGPAPGAVGLAFAAILACSPSGGGPPPSVLLVTLDTTRADFVSHLGGPAGATPHLDALAERSAAFTRARSETNVTNPSHLTLMTGLRAIEHGIFNNQTRIPYELDTLPHAFRRAGYATGGFVSVRHLGPEFGWTGFSEMPPAYGSVRADEVTDRALEWLQQVGDRPFFLWVHYYDPHAPYDPPLEFGARWSPQDPGIGAPPPTRLERTPAAIHKWRRLEWKRKSEDRDWARAMYTAEIQFTDVEMSRLIHAVEAVSGGAIVVVTADHGESLGEHGIEYSHAGVFEPSLRIPLVIHAPDLAPLRSDAPVTSLDVAPTLAELTGATLHHTPSGRSLVPLLSGEVEEAEAPEVFVHQGAHNRGVAARQGRWKLIWPIQVVSPLPGEPLLFDLSADPEELENLAEEHPERLGELRKALEPWIRIGLVRPKDSGHLDDEALEQLRALGYVEP